MQPFFLLINPPFEAIGCVIVVELQSINHTTQTHYDAQGVFFS